MDDCLTRRGGPIVINTVALADHAACETQPTVCDQVNHLLAARIATECALRSVPLIHIGTDGLFGQGTLETAPRYFVPTDEVVPINAYARSKAAAEASLRATNWGHILRLSFVGPDAGTRRGLIRFVADRVRAGDAEISGYSDNWFTPVHVEDVAAAVVAIAKDCPPGFSIRHVASWPAMTKCEYVSRLIEGIGAPVVVRPVERQNRPGAAHAPVDQTLRSADPIAADRVVARSVRDLNEMIG